MQGVVPVAAFSWLTGWAAYSADCHREGRPFVALDRQAAACHKVNQLLHNLEYRTRSTGGQRNVAGLVAAAARAFAASTVSMPEAHPSSNLLYSGEKHHVVLGSASSEEDLRLALSTLPNCRAVFIFFSAFEDTLACIDVLARLNPDLDIHVRIFDEAVENVFEQLQLHEQQGDKRIKTFSSSWQAFEKLQPLLEDEADASPAAR